MAGSTRPDCTQAMASASLCLCPPSPGHSHKNRQGGWSGISFLAAVENRFFYKLQWKNTPAQNKTERGTNLFKVFPNLSTNFV